MQRLKMKSTGRKEVSSLSGVLVMTNITRVRCLMKAVLVH